MDKKQLKKIIAGLASVLDGLPEDDLKLAAEIAKERENERREISSGKEERVTLAI